MTPDATERRSGARSLSAWGFSQEEIRATPKAKRTLVLELLDAILEHGSRGSGRNWERHAYLLHLLMPAKFPMQHSWGQGAALGTGQPRPVIAISFEKAKELRDDHDKFVPRVRELLGRNGLPPGATGTPMELGLR